MKRVVESLAANHRHGYRGRYGAPRDCRHRHDGLACTSWLLKCEAYSSQDGTSTKLAQIMNFDCLGVTDPLDAYEIGTVYYTQNGKVVRQTWGSDYMNFMDFIYDNHGNPYARKYNNNRYE